LIPLVLYIELFGKANSLAEKGCNQSYLSYYTGELKNKRKLKKKKNY